MPVTPITNTARIVVSQSLAEEQIVNVLHVRSMGGDFVPGEETADIVANFFATGQDGVNAGLPLSVHTETWRLDSVSIQWIGTAPFDDATIYNYGISGTESANEELPPQTALVVSLRTGGAGRRGRGRIFLGGLHEGSSEDSPASVSRPAANLLLSVETAFTTMLNRLTTVGNPLVVASQVNGTSREVTQFVLDNKWATQRRRARDIPVTARTVVNL